MVITEAMRKERTRALKAFMTTPQSMDAICNALHLWKGEQVHKDLLRAIIQVTGYGKEHVKAGGLIEPRELLTDGTRSATFAKDFKEYVDHFLNQLKAGILFFPVILPRYEGWGKSFCRSHLLLPLFCILPQYALLTFAEQGTNNFDGKARSRIKPTSEVALC